jgi:DNA polymerase III subunit gamma/tau
MTQALYLKYRPQTFSGVAGQAPVVTTLKRALAGKRLSHAYLFTGPRGTGKTTTARLLAKGINCRKPKAGEPDNTCDICKSIADGSSLDLIEIDAASNRGIDEIRELRDKVNVAPTVSARKVYIIDEVHMLTKEAFNALLKTLEEPPSHVTFVLATTEPDKVPETIISRCQRFDFRPASPALVAKQLAEVAKREKVKLPADAAELIARQARGSFRDALSIFDLLLAAHGAGVSAQNVRETLGLTGDDHLERLEEQLVAGDRAQALAVIRDAAESGVAPEIFRADFVDHLRRRLRVKIGAETAEGDPERTAAWQANDLIRAIKLFMEAADRAGDSAAPELPLELAALEYLADQPVLAKSDAVPAAPTTPNKDTTPAVGPGPPPKTQAVSGSAAKQKPVPELPKPPKGAQDLWEKLLEATKREYSLSVCLQRTRPAKLGPKRLDLSVFSEFFLKKLEQKETRARIEAELRKLAGRKVAIGFTLAPSETEQDVFEGALNTFEGAEVENG